MPPRLELPLTGGRVRLEAGDEPHSLRVVRLADESTVGHVAFDVVGKTITVHELCIDPAERSFGCGSDAARLLVHASEDAGFERFTAWAPPDLGLAVYFWFRMGLRPLQGEGLRGGIWLERRLGAPAARPQRT